MNTSSRFAVATHILTLLTLHREEPLTSEYIAGSVNTNPVVIRRVLGDLRAAGLVGSQSGNGGGWWIAGDPAAITLRDVYRAVEGDALLPLHHRPPNPECLVGKNIQQALTRHIDAAQHALEEELARTTIADMLQDVLEPAR